MFARESWHTVSSVDSEEYHAAKSHPYNSYAGTALAACWASGYADMENGYSMCCFRSDSIEDFSPSTAKAWSDGWDQRYKEKGIERASWDHRLSNEGVLSLA